MDASIIRLVLACCTTAHFTTAAVLALYARHKVEYLSIAWIMGIFSFMLLGTTLLSTQLTDVAPGVLHPAVLAMLVAISYLQSIYPLHFSMPGYLQWGRMWKYAMPAIVLIILYSILMVFVGKVDIVDSLSEWLQRPFSVDLWLRMAALALSTWYIINIFRLPHRVAHNALVPIYTYVYSALLGLSTLFYCYVSIDYSPQMFIVYMVMFTFLNLYLSFRTLETMAINLPKPVIEEVKAEPSEEELRKAEEDFNEANLQRFNRVQFWMQNNREEWTSNTFGRDNLCRAVGLNRHLVLQCLRSQGYNNVHDYINSYRIDYMKRLIRRGQITTLNECLDVGFGTTKTARTCFEKHEGHSLDDYLADVVARRE